MPDPINHYREVVEKIEPRLSNHHNGWSFSPQTVDALTAAAEALVVATRRECDCDKCRAILEQR